MKTYRVNKNVNKEPYILGLRLPLFYIFAGIVAVAIFSLIGGVTLFRFLAALSVLATSFFVLRKLNTGDLFSIILNEKFPKTVITDNYK
jgi:hypothetical protein